MQNILSGIGGAVLLAAGASAPALAVASDPPRTGTPVRVVYSASVLQNISTGDAKAAIRVWGESLANEMGVDAYAEVDLVPDAPAILVRFRDATSDFGSTTILEFSEIESELDADPVFALVSEGKPTLSYVLLVRADSGIHDLAGLRGGELRVLGGPRGCLALPWMDQLCARSGLGTASQMFAHVTSSEKPSSVVLPVFFGQATACVVTRVGFETMRELNPQVGQTLRAIEESPGLVPIVAFFRRGFRPTFRDDLIQSILNLPSSPTGKQILNLIQSEGMLILSPEELKPTRDLVRSWRDQQTGHQAEATHRRPLVLAGGNQ